MFRLALIAQIALSAALEAGDCAFVGIYGEQDDFAVVLLEDAKGEKVSLTDSYGDQHFKVGHVVEASVDLKRGSVLKKKDFTGAPLMSPLALTLFQGDVASPTVLCTIRLEGKKDAGLGKRRLGEVIMDLGDVESAQYSGDVRGTKDELLKSIMEPSNWQIGAPRQLEGFSVAQGNMTTTMMTTTTDDDDDDDTTMAPMNTTMMPTTTTEEDDDMTTTEMNDDETTSPPPPPPPAATISGCLGFTTASADELIASDAAEMAFKTTIATLLPGVTAEMITELTLTKGMCSSMRRLGERRLQTDESVTASYVIVFPQEMEGGDPVMMAEAAQTALEAWTETAVETALTAQFTAQSLSFSVTVTEVPAPTITFAGTTMRPDAGASTSSALLGMLLLACRAVM